MNNIRSYRHFAAISGLVFALSACTDGPAEKTGEKIDDASTDIENSIEDTCEGVKDTLNAEDKDC
jgi:hypothetical protein